MLPVDLPADLAETRLVLLDLARRGFGRIKPERIVDHVLAITHDADFPVRRAAVEALARRYAFAERDELRIDTRPPVRAVLGAYRTKSALKARRSAVRPYTTALLSVSPLAMSCSCADFVRSALGLCKHGLVVLEALEKSSALTRAHDATLAPSRVASLGWDAVHPLKGSTDRLARLLYVHAGRGAIPPGVRDGKPLTSSLRTPAQRLELIAELERRVARGALVPQPAVLTLLAEERAAAERRLQAKASAKPALKSLIQLTRTLYPYQREGVQRFFETGRLLLADDMGLGKTTQAIAACHGLFATARVARGLLIVPAALKAQWKREWDATTSVPLTLVEGSPDERARLYAQTKRGFLVIGYEQLLRDFGHVQKFAPEMVVLDEAQRIKNWATKSAAYVKALSPTFRLVLTGTPMENRFAELASIMDFVDDVALEPKWRLLPFHTLYEGNAGKGVGGARNLEVLRARLAGTMVRRVRKEVLTQLPARTDTRVPVEMTEVQRTHHEDLRRPIAELVQKASVRPLRPPEFLRLMQLLMNQRMICNGMAQLNFGSEWTHLQTLSPTPDVIEGLSTPKLSVLRGLIEQVVVAQHRKVVIFSQWRSMLKLAHWAVRDVLDAAGMRAVFFTGAESSKLRERAIVELHDDPATTVMFLSDAGGIGLNLQRAASCCINLELPWNPAVLEQRIGRIYRLGQKLPIDVYNLVTEEGIESNIAKLLGKKAAVFASLFDGTTDEVVFDGNSSFLEGVKKLVDAVVVPAAVELEASAEGELLGTPSDESAVLAPLAEAGSSLVGVEPAQVGVRGLSVTRMPDGGIRIDAPEELAAPLAELLEALARSLRSASTPSAERA